MNKIKENIRFLTMLLVLPMLFGALCIYKACSLQPQIKTVVETDTVTRIDTVRDTTLVPVEVIRTRTVTARLPLATTPSDTMTPEYNAVNMDSATVQVPISQYHYRRDSVYDIYASGYQVTLDSVLTYPVTKTINIVKTTTVTTNRKNRLVLGLSAGYHYGLKSRSFEPAVGVTLTFPLLKIK